MGGDRRARTERLGIEMLPHGGGLCLGGAFLGEQIVESAVFHVAGQ